MRLLRLLRTAAAAAFAVLLACAAARAETPPPAEAPRPLMRTWGPQQPWLTGTWGGTRSELYEKGVDLQLVYVSELAYNVAGGTKSLVDYTDQVAFGATFNLERLLGIPNALIQLTYTERAGRNLVDDAQLGTLQLVQEVYGRGQTVRLTELWYEQRYLSDLLNLKFGRLPVGGDFAVFPCDFQNLTFCGSQPGNVAGNYIFNWPISQWGGRLKVKLEGFGYYQVGVYDQNDQYLGFENKLLPVWYPNSAGVLVPVELAWQPVFGGRLGGSYKVGGWYSSAQMNDAAYDINGNFFALTGLPPARRKGLYGGYLTFQQQLTRTSEENPNSGLRVFLNATFADIATSVTDHQVATGFWYTGPFASRPHDVVAFAAGTTHVNNATTNAATLQNAMGLGPVPVKNAEYVFELDYTFAVADGFLIRPNIQYIYSPGGNYATKDVVVLGLKTLISF